MGCLVLLCPHFRTPPRWYCMVTLRSAEAYGSLITRAVFWRAGVVDLVADYISHAASCQSHVTIATANGEGYAI